MRICRAIGAAPIFAAALYSAFAQAKTADASPDARADATVRAMRPEEKVILTHGVMAVPIIGPLNLPSDGVLGAGYIPGIDRLGVPSLRESDASLGVSYVFGMRKDGATALPSALAMASTWNPGLIRRGGQMIGSEARAKGFNVLLAGGVNLMRDPRNGRSFEYFSEDPLLSGILGGNAIKGIQSNHIISTIKHMALNGQETGRKFVDVKISDAAARESDLLAFKIGIEIGDPGAVMCAYNLVNAEHACASDYLLNKVLKQDWRYKGFVMSDWGAVPGVDAALKGLDQQSGEQLDTAIFLGDKLVTAAQSDPRYAARLDDMNRRIIWAIYANGLDKHPAQAGGSIDLAANSAVALETAKQGIVLLRNARDVLPLARTAKSIAVIGGFADIGVLSGAGSSQVHGPDGPAANLTLGDSGPFSVFMSQQYHASVPLKAIKAMAPQAVVKFRNGRSASEAASLAAQADIAIVFANKWSGEGMDQPDLSLPDGQDAVIAAVAAANPNSIIVLQTGNPILMPWLNETAAVIQAWYPGARGGEAIASVLFGETNPSGRLPVTFPASEAQLPRVKVDGFATVEPSFAGNPTDPDAKLVANYDIEGSDLGYRWNARKGQKALFPFGYGLSYTSFEISDLKSDGTTATFLVRNTGDRAGATVGQVYLVSRNGDAKLRLVGFSRVELAAGTSRKISVSIDPRLLADWKDGQWSMPGGTFTFAIGDNSEALGRPVNVRMSARSWKD
jgi:beta-glucosidase